MRKILIISGIVLGLLLVLTGGFLALRFIFGGNEDTWLCENGQWVKHGNPSSEKPTEGCGESEESKKEESEELSCQVKNRDPGGPYYHQIYSAGSTDGLNWTKNGQLLFEHASVPGAIIKDGIIYLYFVDQSAGDEVQLSVAISKDLGKTFEKHKVLNSEMASCDMVDPHPEVVYNKIRLYYFGGFMGAGDPAKQDQAHKFYSAVSDDGINFKNQQLAYEDSQITDPDVFQTDKDWRMLVSKGRGLDLLISTDSGITFKKEEGFSWDKGGVCDTFNFNDTYRTFYCGMGIESALGAEQGKLTQEQGRRIEEQGKITCDPSVIQLPDASYLMFYKVQEAQQQKEPTSTMPQASP